MKLHPFTYLALLTSSFILVNSAHADELACAKFAQDKHASFRFIIRNKTAGDYLRDLGNLGWGPWADNHIHSTAYTVDMTLNNGMLTLTGQNLKIGFNLKDQAVVFSGQQGARTLCSKSPEICVNNAQSMQANLIEPALNSDDNDGNTLVCLNAVLSRFSRYASDQYMPHSGYIRLGPTQQTEALAKGSDRDGEYNLLASDSSKLSGRAAASASIRPELVSPEPQAVDMVPGDKGDNTFNVVPHDPSQEPQTEIRASTNSEELHD
jgi:hypothetical protein